MKRINLIKSWTDNCQIGIQIWSHVHLTELNNLNTEEKYFLLPSKSSPFLVHSIIKYSNLDFPLNYSRRSYMAPAKFLIRKINYCASLQNLKLISIKLWWTLGVTVNLICFVYLSNRHANFDDCVMQQPCHIRPQRPLEKRKRKHKTEDQAEIITTDSTRRDFFRK